MKYSMAALKIIERDKSANGFYKGQIITDCVIEKVAKSLRVTAKNMMKRKYHA